VSLFFLLIGSFPIEPLCLIFVSRSFPYHKLGDTYAYEQQIASLWKFFLPNDRRPHGFLLDSVVEKMPWTEGFRIVPAPYKEIHLLQSDGENWQEVCNRTIDNLLDIAREKGVFPKLGKKRDEKLPIVGAKFPVSIERSAATLFGIIGRGVHMTVYTRTESGLKFWVPQRNPNKSTYPGMLDNTVAGGVADGETPFECLLREASEEAALTEDPIRKNTHAAGTVSWFNVCDERAGGEPGLINPGVLYVYDLEVGQDVVFKPVDNDIYAFHLMDIQQVKYSMASGKFKPASANVMMDFFIRHGLITAEDDEDYIEIVSRLHRKMPFATTPSS
jgi:8-oxo-dGTP pyrophosphatase MutT (NUDIX family)